MSGKLCCTFWEGTRGFTGVSQCARLLLQISLAHWQTLPLTSCETLVWLLALEEREEGTLVYIWRPRLLSSRPTSGRQGGQEPLFALKRNLWPWLSAAPCPHRQFCPLCPIRLLAPYHPTSPWVKGPTALLGCPLVLVAIFLCSPIFSPRCTWIWDGWCCPAQDRTKMKLFRVLSREQPFGGMAESWMPLAIMEEGSNQTQSMGMGRWQMSQAINKIRITSHPHPLYADRANQPKKRKQYLVLWRILQSQIGHLDVVSPYIQSSVFGIRTTTQAPQVGIIRMA